MPAFKLFLQIVNSKKYMIILYYSIFLMIFLLISVLTAQSAEGQYEETSLNVGVIDRDHSVMSKGLLAFLDDSHSLTVINDEKNAMQDALYRQEVSCLLIIPKGFGSKFASDGSIPLQSVSSPDNAQAGPLITSQLEDYLGNVSVYMASGSTEEEALASARSLASIRTDIAFQDGQQVTRKDQLPGSYYYFLFYSYISLCIMLSCICPVLVVFYQPDVYRRCICSGTKLRAFNLQLALGTLCFTLFLLISLLTIGFALSHGEVTFTQAGWIILNAAAFTLCATALTYLCGYIAKNDMAVAGLANTIALSLCFLGGIFVPLELISSKVLAVSRLMPTYWYMTITRTLFVNPDLTAADTMRLWQGLGLQLGFAAAVFSIALLVSRRRRQFTGR